MINWDQLPNWLSQGLWAKALTASGLNGTYFLEFDDEGYLISSQCLDPLRAWVPISKFMRSFVRLQQFNDYKQTGGDWEASKNRLKSNITDALIYSLSGIQWDVNDHECLWRYEPGSIYSMSQDIEVTIYHLNDRIAKSKGKGAWSKNHSKENCVIFKVVVTGWVGMDAPDWNTTAIMPIELLFG